MTIDPFGHRIYMYTLCTQSIIITMYIYLASYQNRLQFYTKSTIPRKLNNISSRSRSRSTEMCGKWSYRRWQLWLFVEDPIQCRDISLKAPTLLLNLDIIISLPSIPTDNTKKKYELFLCTLAFDFTCAFFENTIVYFWSQYWSRPQETAPAKTFQNWRLISEGDGSGKLGIKLKLKYFSLSNPWKWPFFFAFNHEDI